MRRTDGKLFAQAMVLAVLMPACEKSEKPSRAPLPQRVSSVVSSEAIAKQPPEVDTDDTRRERSALLQQIRSYENLSPKVVQAMLDVPRHAFVPARQRHRAYEDTPLSIGHGQTISQPTVVAMMTEALGLRGDETVLEVGAGSGYQAAVLSRLAKRVETIEIVEPLANMARAALTRVGYDNVRVHVGDGYEGLPGLAPFDRIIITAAPPEVPEKLIAQLAVGGKMVLPVGPRFSTQDLIVIEKRADGTLHRRNLGPVRFVPMVHADEQ